MHRCSLNNHACKSETLTLSVANKINEVNYLREKHRHETVSFCLFDIVLGCFKMFIYHFFYQSLVEYINFIKYFVYKPKFRDFSKHFYVWLLAKIFNLKLSV